MPRYGYQLQQQRLAGQQPTQSGMGAAMPQMDNKALQQQLVDLGALVPIMYNTFGGRETKYVTPFEAYQRNYLGDGGG
jgi:hypothetical protein